MAPIQRVNALMIDDDPEAVLLMGMQLNEACGPDLHFVLEGSETLKAGLLQVGRGDYDVILLVRISDQTRHRLGALPATLSEHYPPASRTITRHPFGGDPATAG